MMGDLMRLLNEDNKFIEECPLKPAQLAGMLGLIGKGTISGKIAKTVFEEMYRSGKNAEEIVKEKGLLQISDESAIEKAVNEVIAEHPQEVEKIQSRRREAFGVLRRPGDEGDEREGQP